MKKIFVFILFLVLVFSQVGYYFVSVTQQHFHKIALRKKIVEQLDKKELIAISFADNAAKILWEEKGKEFSLNGKMYDIVKKDSSAGKLIFYCVDDETEARLVAKYTSNTKNNTSKKINNTEKTNVLFCEQFILFICDALAKTTAENLYSSALTYSYENTTSPPPKNFI